MKCHGVWAYGWVLNVYFIDELGRHDSSAILEMVSRTIEDATCHDQQIVTTWMFFQ